MFCIRPYELDDFFCPRSVDSLCLWKNHIAPFGLTALIHRSQPTTHNNTQRRQHRHTKSYNYYSIVAANHCFQSCRIGFLAQNRCAWDLARFTKHRQNEKKIFPNIIKKSLLLPTQDSKITLPNSRNQITNSIHIPFYNQRPCSPTQP